MTDQGLLRSVNFSSHNVISLIYLIILYIMAWTSTLTYSLNILGYQDGVEKAAFWGFFSGPVVLSGGGGVTRYLKQRQKYSRHHNEFLIATYIM
jgi:hypothetical protein